MFDVTSELPLIGVVVEHSAAVIGIIRSALKCLTCPQSSSFCSHLKFIQKCMESDGSKEESEMLIPLREKLSQSDTIKSDIQVLSQSMNKIPLCQLLNSQ